MAETLTANGVRDPEITYDRVRGLIRSGDGSPLEIAPNTGKRDERLVSEYE